MNNMMNELYSIGLIPVIKIENADDAVPLAKALIDGGLPAAEITFRTACAAEAIKNITEAFPEMLVGAGTVLTTEQVDQAIRDAIRIAWEQGSKTAWRWYFSYDGHAPRRKPTNSEFIAMIADNLRLRYKLF